MYKFEYDITKQEYIDFNEYHLLHSETGKRTLMLTRGMGLILSILVITVLLITGTEKGLLIPEIVFLTVFSIIWFASGKRTAIKNMKKNMKKLEKENGKLYSDKGTLIFDENGITDISEDKELKTPYSTITQLCTGTDAFYIYFSPMAAYVLPFRIIDTYCNINEFKAFLENNTALTFK